MTRDQLVDCLRGKEGKPISIRHTGGIVMGVFEYIIWDTAFPDIKGIRLVDNDVPVRPSDIIEIHDAPLYTDALKMMREINKSQQ